MDFHIGDKVVCVYPKRKYSCPNPLVKGQIYEVSGIYVCPCSSIQLCLQESDYQITMVCGCGKTEKRTQSYYANRFRKLAYWEIYCELFKNKKELGEKEDIPKPVPEKIKQN